jgi:hypothetical protein
MDLHHYQLLDHYFLHQDKYHQIHLHLPQLLLPKLLLL